jgi:hypothetical protein
MKSQLLTTLLFAFAINVHAETNLVIHLEGNGQLSWSNSLPGVDHFYVEWAPTPSGPWTNSWDSLKQIAPTSTFITVSVPMFYRVVMVPIPNYPPSQPGIEITPFLPTSTNELVCSIVTPSTDSNSTDTVIYQYAWRLNGTGAAISTNNTLSSDYTARGDLWQCEVTPTDGVEAGPPATTEKTIQNSRPILTSIQLNNPTVGVDDLIVSYDGYDADGDAITYAIQWSEDGVLRPDLDNLDSVPAADVGSALYWEVSVTPNDGIEVGLTGYDSFTL